MGMAPPKISVDSLSAEERIGFDNAVLFSLDRNRANKRFLSGTSGPPGEWALKGAAVAKVDPVVQAARTVESGVGGVFFALGFDVATGIFGQIALGGAGHTSEGPGSEAARDELLSQDAQRGFRASVDLHLVKQHGRAALPGRTVLVVDDEEEVRAIVSRMLRNMGHAVRQACDGDAALDALAAHDGGAIDLVLLDLTMPKRSGPATLTEMRARGIMVPVIIASGFSAEAVPEGAGIAGFVQKPFRGETLERAIAAAFAGT